MKLCHKGLHDMDLPGGRRGRHCRECERAYNRARERTPKRRARASAKWQDPAYRAKMAAKMRERRRSDPVFRAKQHQIARRWARLKANDPEWRGRLNARVRQRRAARAVEELRAMPRSYLNGAFARQPSRAEKLRLMATQTVSPLEAAIARQKLEVCYDERA